MTDLLTLTFGKRDPLVEYRIRPGSYALIQNVDGRIAAIETRTGLHLPGGGADPGESPEQTLKRELLEEIGQEVITMEHVGNANQLLHAPGVGHLEKRCTYFRASLASQKPYTESEHAILWVTPEEFAQRSVHESHVWAIQHLLHKVTP